MNQFGKLEPFYFGSSTKPLFGCFHSPQLGTDRHRGVILCSPFGQEHILSHRSFRRLAVLLSRAGFPVLRFDYYGCGDSAGDLIEARIPQWLADVSTAIEELRRRYDCSRICLVGLRLGAALSMMVGTKRDDIDGMVLWDPIISGKEYVRGLLALPDDNTGEETSNLQPGVPGESPIDLLGFPLTEVMLHDLRDIDLLAGEQKPASNILFIETRPDPLVAKLKRHLEIPGGLLQHESFPGPPVWAEDINRVLVPAGALQSIVSWISEIC